MAGGHMKYRTLSRSSAHRQALLRNMVTSLFRHESITTTWHKAKEAQRLAEKLVTLGKRNTQAARDKAGSIFYDHTLVPKLFSTIRTRYATRPGGYTRVLRLEPQREDQAASAILELVDSPTDTRFALAARAVAATPKGQEQSEVTKGNVVKATRFRGEGAMSEFEKMVSKFRALDVRRRGAERDRDAWAVYEEEKRSAGPEGQVEKPAGKRGRWEKVLLDEWKIERKERVYPELERSRI